MLKTIRLVSLLLTVFSVNSLHAQKAMRYGKVTKEELQMDKCAFDPDANAMVLGESGVLRFRYNNDKGWQYALEVVVRKKIFNEQGKEEGNISIVLYDPVRGGNREEVGTIRASTYNLESGKVVKTKVTSKEEQRTRLNDYQVEVSFAMPNVKNGSIVEYAYTLVSDYVYNLSTWKFQREVPVAYSYFDFTIPEYFNYQLAQLGNVIDLDFQEEATRESFTYKWTSTPQAGGRVERGTNTLDSESVRRKAIARNVAALEEEPLMNNAVDRPTRIEFQLSTTKMPNQPINHVAQDYTQFSKEILDWSSFGKKLDDKGIAKELVTNLSSIPDLEKAKMLYKWLTEKVTWNEVYSVTGSEAGKELLRKKTGKVGDINLTLVALLRDAGLVANPVILSTRGHGTVHPVYPNLQDFNYVIVSTEINGKEYLLDASAKLPFGTLPVRCYNGQGWKPGIDGGSWVNLKNGSHTASVSSIITFDDESIKTTMAIKYGGHAGIYFTRKARVSGDEGVKDLINEAFEDGVLDNLMWTDSLGMETPSITLDWIRDMDDPDIIYLSPLAYGPILEVPFKRDERFSPIDYKYKVGVTALTKVNLPEGYSVELPEPIRMILPDKAAVFTYSVNHMSGVITILSRFQLNKLDYTPEEYKELKTFYETMVEKNTQTIVLKKT